jgi:hypothetical protein
VHYPTIAPIVRAAAKRHGVRYVYYPTLWESALSTYRYLRDAGSGQHWKDMMQPLSGRC